MTTLSNSFSPVTGFELACFLRGFFFLQNAMEGEEGVKGEENEKEKKNERERWSFSFFFPFDRRAARLKWESEKARERSQGAKANGSRVPFSAAHPLFFGPPLQSQATEHVRSISAGSIHRHGKREKGRARHKRKKGGNKSLIARALLFFFPSSAFSARDSRR